MPVSETSWQIKFDGTEFSLTQSTIQGFSLFKFKILHFQPQFLTTFSAFSKYCKFKLDKTQNLRLFKLLKEGFVPSQSMRFRNFKCILWDTFFEITLLTKMFGSWTQKMLSPNSPKYIASTQKFKADFPELAVNFNVFFLFEETSGLKKVLWLFYWMYQAYILLWFNFIWFFPP